MWWGALCFGIQIYCDFSGYTDIALGSAHLLGVELPENFRPIRKPRLGTLEEVVISSQLGSGTTCTSLWEAAGMGLDDGIRTDDDHASGRAMARSLLEFCDLGILARNSPSNQQVPLVERNDIVLIL